MNTGEMVQVSKAEYEKWQEKVRKDKLNARKAAVKVILYVEKAKAAGIKVSKAEVDTRIAEEDAKKSSSAPVPEEI